MTRPGPVAGALKLALRTVTPGPEDAATVALALWYAELLDRAAVQVGHAKTLRIIRRSLLLGDDVEAAEEALVKIEAALSAHTTASDLGPKLLAALTELRMTPRARAAVVKGDGDVRPAAGALDELRARRARADRPASVDPPPS